MTVEELRKKVIDTIAEVVGIEDKNIKPTCKLLEDIKLDELDSVEIILALEDDLGITIDDEDAEKLETVEDLVALVNEKLTVKETTKEPEEKESGDEGGEG